MFDDELSVIEKNLLRPYLIDQDGAGIGYHAAKLLFEQIYSSVKPVVKTFPVSIDESYE